MEPDFSKYSLLELNESLRSINKEKYPGTYNRLINELKYRYGDPVSNNDIFIHESFDQSKQLNKFGMSLTVIKKEQNQFLIILLFIPIMFGAFLFSFFITGFLFGEIIPKGWLYISLLITMILIVYIKSFLFRISTDEIGHIVIYEDHITFNENTAEINIPYNTIKKTIITYNDNKFWKTKSKLNDKIKTFIKYQIHGFIYPFYYHNSVGDIVLDDRSYQIRVINEQDKKSLHQLKDFLSTYNVSVTIRNDFFY